MHKKDFPLLRTSPLVYFDSAATTQKPQVVIDAISSFYEKEYGTVHRAIYKLAARATELYNDARKTVADFIGAESDEIVFTRGTTESINLLAHIFPLQEGDEIIISALEHHSNIVPWQMAAKRFKAKLQVIPILPSGELDVAAYKKLLSPRTKLVSVAWIANSLGTIHPIKTIIDLAHAQGAQVLIDAAQAAAHMPIDVKALDVDFLAFSSHKCYGPTGIGVLYGKRELLAKLPPWHGGGDMIETVSLEETTYNKPPLRFEAGTPMIAEAIGFKAALDYLKKISLEKIKGHEEALTAYCLKRLKELPEITVLGSPKGSIISFVAKGVHPLDLASWLDIKGIALRSGHLCAQPTLKALGLPSLLRISFGLYNSQDEVDYFIDCLKEGLIVQAATCPK